MRRFLFLFTSLLLLQLSSVSYAQLSFDSLNRFYQVRFKIENKNTSPLEDFEKSYSSLIQELSFSDELTQEQLLAVIALTAKLQAGDYSKKSRKLLQDAIVVSKVGSDAQAFLYFKAGDINRREKLPVAALENYLKASLILEQLKHYGPLAYTYGRISLVNFEGRNNEIALSFAKESIRNLNKMETISSKDSSLLSTMYTVNGIVNLRLKFYDDALDYINKSIAISSALGDSLLVAISNGNKAAIFYEKEDYSAAEPLLILDFNASRANNVYVSAFNAGILLGKIYLKTDQPKKLDSLFNLVNEIKSRDRINFPDGSLKSFYELAVGYYSGIQNDDQAKSYAKALALVELRMDSTVKAQDFERLQEKYLMEREITKLQLLQKTNELQQSHLKLRTTLLVIIALTLMVVLWYVYVLRHKSKKIDRLNELLEVKVSERTTRLLEINKELDNYLYRASHDIRRPIRTLLGLNNVMKFTDDPQELKLLFEKVYDTAINMDEMLFKLQMAYELNNSHEIEEVDIIELISGSLDGMERMISAKNAEVIVLKNNVPTILKANNALLKIAIDNILENALIYHNVIRPEIVINTDIGKYFYYVQIQDNGYGIEEAYFEKIFESYFKISNKTQGSGLGLFLANRAISFLGGEIAVESIINEGTKFTIKIPINPK